MKKELLKQFETIVRGHIGEFYARAYAVKGDRAEAEALTVDAIVWGASKFSGLANKERVVDLIVARIGDGSHEGMEFTNEENMISRTMERIRSKGKLKSLVWGVVSCVLVLAILVVTLPRLPYDEWFPEETTTQTDAEGNVIQPVIGAVTMKKTDVIKGDNERITLANYHNLSEVLGKSTLCFDGEDARTKLDRYTATATAPDGTEYLAFTDIPTTKSAVNNPVTLYRMEKDGWKALGSFEVQVNYSENSMWTSYQSSRIYMETDADSNVYIFFMLDKSICIYRYDAKTGEFEKSEASIYTGYKPMRNFSFRIFYDATVGEKGAIYIAYVDMYRADFAYYDIDGDAIVPITKNIGQSSANFRLFCVDNGVIHMIEQTNDSVWYYRIGTDGKTTKAVLSAAKSGEAAESIVHTGHGNGGIVVDKNGKVHVLATLHDSKNSVYEIAHYIIDEDMSFEREALPKLYYEGSDSYVPWCGGLIKNENGDIYYMEFYSASGLGNLFSIGRLGEKIGDAPTCIDIVELPENINTHSFIRITGNTAVFFVEDDLYYCNLKGIGD